MKILEEYVIENYTFVKPTIIMTLCFQSGRGVACGQHLVVGWLPEEVKASIISSENGNWEVKVGIVLPLTLIDDSDFSVYDIYDINQYWIRSLGFYLSIWGYSRMNHANVRFRMSEVTHNRPIGWFLNVLIEKIQSELVFSGSTWIWYYANHP